MRLKKNVSSLLALTLILGSFVASNRTPAFADELSSNINELGIDVSNHQVRIETDGKMVIDNETSRLTLVPNGGTITDKYGNVTQLTEEELQQEAKSSVTFSVELGSTVSKKYQTELSVKKPTGSGYETAVKADVEIKVKCTGDKRIKATSSASNLKGYNGYSPSKSTTDGADSSTSTTKITISATKGGKTNSNYWNSKNTVVSSAGSSQGYLVRVRQEWA